MCSLSERYEDIRDKGTSLAARVEAVLSRLQTRVPGMYLFHKGILDMVARLAARVDAVLSRLQTWVPGMY